MPELNNKVSNPLARLASRLRDAHEQHRARRSPTGFGFVFADRVHYFDQERWDSLARAGSLFLQRSILQVVEEHGPHNVRLRYAMIFRGRKPVVALAVQIATVAGESLHRTKQARLLDRSKNFVRRALAPAVRLAGNQLREQVLVAGNLLSWGFHGLAFAPDEDPAELWPGVAEALYRIRRAERLSGQSDFVMIKDVTAAQNGIDALRRFSYRPLPTEPDMVLDIDPGWRRYDDYLAALDAKYRRNCKDQLKKLAAGGCVIEPLTDLGTHARRLHELYLSVHSNAPIRLVTLPETFLPALARAAGDHFHCTVVRRGDDVLGFVTCLRDGDSAIAYYIGFERAAAAGGLPIYLRLLHATIPPAIEWGCRRLSFGRTALEPKAGLGARPQPMSIWLRHRVPAFNWMIRGMLGAVPHAEAPERNPFKARPAEAGNDKARRA